MSKRLADLYVVGTEVRFPIPKVEGSDKVEPDIVVWLKKLQPFEQEVAVNRANIQRAKILTLKHLPVDHEEVLPFEVQVDDQFAEETLIAYVAQEDLGKAYRSIDSRISNEDEWMNDDYLNSLQQSWEDLKDAFQMEDDPDYADAHRVFDELKRYQEKVDEEFETEKNNIFREWERKPFSEIRRKAVEKLIENMADRKWMAEFKRSQIYLATRDNKDRDKKYFVDFAEVATLHPAIYDRLVDEYDAMSVLPDEGKD